VVDAVFHAHRLQWVLDGRLLFTQVMPSGVTFPYAIGLYVFAAPWSMVTSDFVTLLRVIVVTAEVGAGLLAFVMVRRWWRDDRAAILTVVLLGLVPRTYEIVGNANMTNAFGQSMAFAVLAMATLAVWPRPFGRTWFGFLLLTAAAMLCHVGTLTLLGGILTLLSIITWWWGDRADRTRAIAVMSATVGAVLVAVGVYYEHFGDAYASAARVSSAGADTVYATVSSKVGDTLHVALLGLGWPLVVLGIVGAWRVTTQRQTNRLTWLIAALGAGGTFLAAAVVVMPVEASFQRYNAEFFSRVILATYPAVVLCAAAGLSGWWARGGVWRVASVAGLAAAALIGLRAWVGWMTIIP
jgi:hypothetical protein